MRRGGDVRAVAAAELEGSGFTTRAELQEWLRLCAWLDAPDADPAAFVWLGDGEGWIPAEMVEIKRRTRALTPQATSAPRMLTLREAGVLVRAAPETVRYWIWQGRLTAYKPGGAVLVREDELLALCNSPKTRHIRPGPARHQKHVVGR